MKKHLFVISFVLIFLLAVGAVSADDSYDLADESAISASEGDVDGQVDIDQSDDLSEDDKTPSVDVDDVTVNEGEIVSIPFNVTDSDTVSGGVNVTIYGENETISKYIEFNNATGQADFSVVDLIEIVRANPDMNISDIYDIIYSSWNSTDVNVTEIISGLDDINAGFTINPSDFADGADHIIDGTQVDMDRITEGLNYIFNGTNVNVSQLTDGIDEIISGFNLNSSGDSKVDNILIAIIGGFTINDQKFVDNILDSIIINTARFIDAIKSFGGDASEGSFIDLMKRMGIRLSLDQKIRIGLLYLQNEFTLLEATNILKDIWSYNGLTKNIFIDRLSKVTNGFTFNVSSFIPTDSSSDAFNKLIGSVRINNDKFINSIAKAIDSITFDAPKVATELANITGLDSSQILIFLEGAADIVHGFKFNINNVIAGFKDISAGFSLDGSSGSIKKILDAVTLDDVAFSADFDKILEDFNLTRVDFSNNVTSIISHSHLKLTNELNAALTDALNRKKFNVTLLMNVFKDILTYNNVTGSNVKEMFAGVTVNCSDIVHKIADLDFKSLKTVFNLMHYVKIDYNKLIDSFNGTQVNINYTQVASGIVKVFKGSTINISCIMAGIHKITHEIDYNDSRIIEIIDNVVGNMDPSKMSDGLKKIVGAFTFNKSLTDKGMAKIVSAFKFYRPSIISGLEEIARSIDFNVSMIDGGLYKVASGLGINVSNVIAKFVSKFGYIATFGPAPNPGIYNITVAYIDAEGHVLAVNDTAKLIVLPKKDTPITLDVSVKENHVSIIGNVDSDAKGLVLFEVGNWDTYGLIVDGKVTFDDTFKPGSYNVEAIYLGDRNFSKNSTSASFKVTSKTKITASQVSVVYGNSKSLVVTLKDSNNNVLSGKKVTVKLNGKTYSGTTNAKGQISITVPSNLKPKTYTASLSFAGDSYYFASSGSVKVVVSKGTPKIVASAKTFKKSVKIKKYTITLKNNKNKVMKSTKVTIKVNGKTYSAKTNAKGKATFKITKLTKKGNFKAVITYGGNAYYKKVTKKVNIKVK